MNTLLDMLTYKRPAGSPTDELFRKKFILSDPRAFVDDYGNIILEVGEGSTTLFSCHTDTVHKEDGIQEVIADASLGVAYKDDKNPLGADDGAGCWILLKMIEANVPGVYVFHYGEERGCIGSKARARGDPEWFSRFRRAVAFDRRGTQDVITHQSYGRCCSDEFASALASALNGVEKGLEYRPDDTGVYTDTASYMELIPECTNLSVGYDGEHTGGETLDLLHIEKLARAAIQVEWEELPTKRDPNVRDYLYDFDDWPPGRVSSREYQDWLDERAIELYCEYEGAAEALAVYAAQLEADNDDLMAELKELRAWRKEANDIARAKRDKKRDKKRRRAERKAAQMAGDRLGTPDPWDEEDRIPF